jgi:hypothetical protein
VDGRPQYEEASAGHNFPGDVWRANGLARTNFQVEIFVETVGDLVRGGGSLGLIRANQRNVDQVFGEEPDLEFVRANHLAHK